MCSIQSYHSLRKLHKGLISYLHHIFFGIFENVSSSTDVKNKSVKSQSVGTLRGFLT